MENKKFDILVNFEENDSLTSNIIKMVKGDYNSIDFVFQINKSYDLAMFFLVRPNGTTYVSAINNGKITFTTADIFEQAGLYEFGVSIYDKDSKLTNVQTGEIEVKDNAMILTTDITQEDNYQILDDLINQVSALQEKYNDMDEAIAEFNRLAEQKINEVSSLEIEDYLKMYYSMTYDDKIYTVRFPLFETSNTSNGEKLDDNAGLTCTPGTDTVREVSDYSEAWESIDCNAFVDSNGVRHITALKGMSNFKDTGKVDVFCLFRTYYQKIWEEDGYLYISRTFVPKDGYTIVPQAINKDGSFNQWFLIGKYVVGDIPDDNGTHKLYSSKGLIPAHVIWSPQGNEEISDNISYTGCIPLMRAKGSNYYSAGIMADYMHILTTFYLKFATRNTQSIMAGNTSNSSQYKVAQAENNVSRVILTTAQANNFDLYTYVSVGDPGANTNLDRGQGYMHNKANNVQIIGKEVIDSTKTALILDHEPINVTSTTYVSAMHERSGFSDMILGRTGCVGSLTNGKHGIVLDGVEIAVGGYEVSGNIFMDIVSSTGKRELYYTNDASKLTSNVTTAKSTYKKSSLAIQPTTLNAWNYITKMEFDVNDGLAIPTECGKTGSGSSVGYADGCYVDNATSGQKEFLLLGSLYGGAIAGLSCVLGHHALSTGSWALLARLSINGVGGELTE